MFINLLMSHSIQPPYLPTHPPNHKSTLITNFQIAVQFLMNVLTVYFLQILMGIYALGHFFYCEFHQCDVDSNNAEVRIVMQVRMQTCENFRIIV